MHYSLAKQYELVNFICQDRNANLKTFKNAILLYISYFCVQRPVINTIAPTAPSSTKCILDHTNKLL